MSIEEYYHVFESILYAGILTLIIHGWSKMVMHKKEYEISWVFVALTINFALVVIYRYFAYRTFAFYDVVDTPLDFILFVFLPAGSLLMAAHIAFPDDFYKVDLKRHIIEYRYWILQALIIFNLSNIMHAYLLSILDAAIWIANLAFIGLHVTFLITKKYKLLEIINWISLLVWIFFLTRDSEYLMLKSL